jgi:ABC-2 type transport system permease protein
MKTFSLMRIFAVFIKEAKALGRDSYLLRGIALQPIILTAIFGYAVKSELHEARWTVYDDDATSLSRELVSRIEAAGEVTRPGRASSYAQVDRIFRMGDASSAALVIPRGFARTLEQGRDAPVQLLLNGADTFAALRLSTVVTDVAQRFPDATTRRRRELRSHEANEPMIVLRRSLRFNPKREDTWFFIPTIPAIFLTQLFYGIACFAIAAERERFTYEHLLAMPLRPIEILVGKALAIFAIGFVLIYAYYLLFAPLALGIEVRGSIGALTAATLFFFIDAYLVSALLSTIAKSMQQATYLTVFTVLPSTVISGFLVPVSTMPKAIQWASLTLPTTHYVTMLRAIIVRGAPLTELGEPLLGLTIIGVVALGLVLVFFPRRLV